MRITNHAVHIYTTAEVSLSVCQVKHVAVELLSCVEVKQIIYGSIAVMVRRLWFLMIESVDIRSALPRTHFFMAAPHSRLT